MVSEEDKGGDGDGEVPLPTSSTASGRKTICRLTDIPPPDELMGTRPFELSCIDVPQGSLLPKTRHITEVFPGSGAYRTLLKKAVNESEDNSMKGKFFPPSGKWCDDKSPWFRINDVYFGF